MIQKRQAPAVIAEPGVLSREGLQSQVQSGGNSIGFTIGQPHLAFMPTAIPAPKAGEVCFRGVFSILC